MTNKLLFIASLLRKVRRDRELANSGNINKFVNDTSQSDEEIPSEVASKLPSLAKKMSRRGITVDLDEATKISSHPELVDDIEEACFPALSTDKKKKSKIVSKDNSKEFKGLVAMINYSSKTKGSGGTESVLKRWGEMSRIGSSR